jgi:hypothetical protein
MEGNADCHVGLLLILAHKPLAPTNRRRLLTMRKSDDGYLTNLCWLGSHRNASMPSTLVNRVTSTWSSRAMSVLSGARYRRPSPSPSTGLLLPCPGMPRRMRTFSGLSGLSSSHRSVFRLKGIERVSHAHIHNHMRSSDGSTWALTSRPPLAECGHDRGRRLPIRQGCNQDSSQGTHLLAAYAQHICQATSAVVFCFDPDWLVVTSAPQ